MVKGSEETFLQKRYTNGHCANEKMFNITSHQRNKNLNNMRYYLKPLEWEWVLGGRRNEQKREKELIDEDNRVVIVGVKEGIWGIHGDESKI